MAILVDAQVVELAQDLPEIVLMEIAVHRVKVVTAMRVHKGKVDSTVKAVRLAADLIAHKAAVKGVQAADLAIVRKAREAKADLIVQVVAQAAHKAAVKGVRKAKVDLIAQVAAAQAVRKAVVLVVVVQAAHQAVAVQEKSKRPSQPKTISVYNGIANRKWAKKTKKTQHARKIIRG